MLLGRYDTQESWDIGRNIRIEVGKAHRLIRSPAVYKNLDELCVFVVEDLDQRLIGIDDSSRDEWDKFHRDLKDKIRLRIDHVLLSVARDLSLAPNKEANR